MMVPIYVEMRKVAWLAFKYPTCLKMNAGILWVIFFFLLHHKSGRILVSQLWDQTHFGGWFGAWALTTDHQVVSPSIFSVFIFCKNTQEDNKNIQVQVTLGSSGIGTN